MRNQAEDAGTYKLPALAILSEISAGLATENDLEALIRRFLNTMMRLVGARAGAVWLLDEEQTHMRLAGSAGLPAELTKREHIVPMSCGVCSEAAASNTVCISSELEACMRRTGSTFFRDACRRVLAVPLQYRGRVLGTYSFFLPDGAEVPEEVSVLFRSIGEHLGMALENARLTRENVRAALMNERQMLANEVHDSLAQTLAYMKMRVAMLRESVEAGNQSVSVRHLSELNEAVETAYASVRELLTQFRKRMDPRGLQHALKETVDRYHASTGIVIDFSSEVGYMNLTVDQEVHVFHIVQEALANVAKHSQARHARLALERNQNEYVVSVEDDGVGAAPDCLAGLAPPEHFGISIMRERASRLGGTLTIEGLANRGTRLRLTLPVPEASEKLT